MKNIFYLLILFPFLVSAQYAVADFIVLNDGKEKEYEKLEMAWSIFRQNQIDKGQKMNWAVWKRTPQKEFRGSTWLHPACLSRAILATMED